MARKFNEIEKLRRDKLDAYRKLGINPYSRDIDFTDTSQSLAQKYSSLSKEELSEQNHQTTMMMRIFTKRGPFLVGKDATGKVQIYVPKDLDISILKLRDTLDIGDIIKVVGRVMKTNTGQLSVRADQLHLITKSLRPLPEKFHGLKDVEERYRRRYVDLLMNEEVRNTFLTRTKLISGMRVFFDGRNFLEVETPVLSPILGGAAAKPFITKHNALDMNFYLRVATELSLKKLLVGGFDKVYEIGRLFRNEGIDTTHNPEFTTIEFYETYANLQTMMHRTEELLTFLSKHLSCPEIKLGNNIVKLDEPFAKIEMATSVSEALGQDVKKMQLADIKQIAKKHQIAIEPYYTYGHILSALFEKLVESKIVQPTFVFGHPIEISPLAAINEQDSRFTDRAELFINGREYANMFTELNDPIDQMTRFEKQHEEGKSGNEEANEIDLDFVEALEYGMPPSGGCGIGVDRLVMLFTGRSSIREVLLFPHLKQKKEPDAS